MISMLGALWQLEPGARPGPASPSSRFSSSSVAKAFVWLRILVLVLLLGLALLGPAVWQILSSRDDGASGWLPGAIRDTLGRASRIGGRIG